MALCIGPRRSTSPNIRAPQSLVETNLKTRNDSSPMTMRSNKSPVVIPWTVGSFCIPEDCHYV